MKQKNAYHPAYFYEAAKDNRSFHATKGLLYEKSTERPAERGYIS